MVEIKVLKRVISDITMISQIARMLRDQPMTDQERATTTNTLCDSISTLLNSASDYLEVSQQLHVKGAVLDFMGGIKNGNNEESKP